jgi:hypothetical protein
LIISKQFPSGIPIFFQEATVETIQTIFIIIEKILWIFALLMVIFPFEILMDSGKFV